VPSVWAWVWRLPFHQVLEWVWLLLFRQAQVWVWVWAWVVVRCQQSRLSPLFLVGQGFLQFLLCRPSQQYLQCNCLGGNDEKGA